MKISIITLFPEMFEGPFAHSMLWKAQKDELVELEVVNLRDFGIGKRNQVDDTPYGGGAGMLLKPEPVVEAIEETKTKGTRQKAKVILLSPQGEQYHQAKAETLSEEEHLILVCGRYEGFDERIREFVDAEISIGNYILTGGEIPAMVVVDSVVRLIPGVLGDEQSAVEESFSDGETLEYPQYTRPENFRDMKVPDVLLSGHHEKIRKWREDQAHNKTRLKREKNES